MLGIDDEHGLALEANPAAVGEGSQGLVDGLAGSADQLGNLFLGEIVVDAQRAAFLDAEAVSQLQQGLGNTAGHIGEDEVCQVGVSAAQAAGQHAQQLLGDGGVIANPLIQQLGVHGGGLDLSHADGGRGARARIEDGELAEHIGRAHHGQEVFAAIRGVTGELNLAGGDDIQTVTGLAFIEDGGTAREAHCLHLLEKILHCYGINALEDSGAGEGVLYAFHVLLLGCRLR